MTEQHIKPDPTQTRTILADILQGLLRDLMYFAIGASLGAIGGALTMAFYFGLTSAFALGIGAIGGAIAGLAVLGFVRGFLS